MHRMIRFFGVVASLLCGSSAWAQFGNQSLGLSVGYMSIVDPTIEWGLPLTVESSRYLENSWEATFRGSAMVLTERVQNRQVWGLGGAVGLRYLFKEESVRPYVGAELNYLHIFRDEGLSNLVGLAPNLGIDLFVSDSVAVGARGLLNIYWALNEALRLAPGGQLVISTYF